MITKEAFVAALSAIKGPESRWRWERTDSEVSLALNFAQMEHLSAQLRLLRAALPDPHDYVGRWLFEQLEPIPRKDGTTVTIPWDAPGALYDLLVKEASELPEEELPLWDLPGEDGLTHKGIRPVDLFNHFDAVLAYVERRDVVIHIMEAGQEDMALSGKEPCRRLFVVTEGEVEKGAEDAVIDLSMDPQLEQKFRELLAPTGLTVEQMAQMFFSWCAHYPEDAAAWLKRTAEEQGVDFEEKAGETT